MSKKLVLVDINNVGFAHQMAGQKLTSGSNETTSLFGCLKTLRTIKETYDDHQIILLWDGRSWRHEFVKSVAVSNGIKIPEYKGNRTPNKKMATVKDAWIRQAKVLRETAPHLGVWQMLASKHEADDLAFFITRNSTPDDSIILYTSDQDWLQCVQKENVTWHDWRHDRVVTLNSFEEFTGVKPSRFALLKAMQGDSSDNIPGIAGVGPVMAKKVIELWESPINMLADENPSASWTKQFGSKFPKALENYQASEEAQNQFSAGYVLVNMRVAPTIKSGEKQVTNGNFNKEAFLEACKKYGFLSIMREIDRWIRPFENNRR